jgi:hypothetical protein
MLLLQFIPGGKKKERKMSVEVAYHKIWLSNSLDIILKSVKML